MIRIQFDFRNMIFFRCSFRGALTVVAEDSFALEEW